jgi:predicted AAA+ superfamily ATPase
MLERLKRYEEELLARVPTQFYRFVYPALTTNDRLVGLMGASGMGKTTLLLQRTHALREEYDADRVLYLTLDYPYLANIDLVELADDLYRQGVRYLMIDEIHRHPHFLTMLKSIYDNVIGMQILFAGSAGMPVGKFGARLTLHRIGGMSLREFLSIGREEALPHFTLAEILSDHSLIAKELSEHFDIAKSIRLYLRRGYYPAHTHPQTGYIRTILDSVNTTLDIDLVSTGVIEQKYTYKMRRVLEVLSQYDGGRVNLTRIAESAEVSRVKLYDYLRYMEEAGLLKLAALYDKDAKQKAKPARIYLNNTSLLAFYNPKAAAATLRETFFINQLSAVEEVKSTKDGIFVAQEKIFFQLNTPEKGAEEIYDLRRNGYRIVDTLISDHPNRIPLWLFGFLY